MCFLRSCLSFLNCFISCQLWCSYLWNKEAFFFPSFVQNHTFPFLRTGLVLSTPATCMRRNAALPIGDVPFVSCKKEVARKSVVHSTKLLSQPNFAWVYYTLLGAAPLVWQLHTSSNSPHHTGQNVRAMCSKVRFSFFSQLKAVPNVHILSFLPHTTFHPSLFWLTFPFHNRSMWTWDASLNLAFHFEAYYILNYIALNSQRQIF